MSTENLNNQCILLCIQNINYKQVAEKYQNAFLTAVTLRKQCVGIRLFPENVNNNNRFASSEFVDKCINEAIELKSTVETGFCEIKSNENIILRPPIKVRDMNAIIASKHDCE